MLHLQKPIITNLQTLISNFLVKKPKIPSQKNQTYFSKVLDQQLPMTISDVFTISNHFIQVFDPLSLISCIAISLLKQFQIASVIGKAVQQRALTWKTITSGTTSFLVVIFNRRRQTKNRVERLVKIGKL